MDEDAIAAYLRQLEAALRRAGRPTEPLVDEAAAHLVEDAARIAAAERCSDAEAAGRAVARFGDVRDVVRAARRNEPLAAGVARVVTLMLMVALVGEIVDAIRNGELVWPPAADDLWLTFAAELVLVSWSLWRAVVGGVAPAWLRPALALQGALATAIVFASLVVNSRFVPLWQHVTVRHISNLVAPFWLLMAVQGVAGLRALSRTRSTFAS